MATKNNTSSRTESTQVCRRSAGRAILVGVVTLWAAAGHAQELPRDPAMVQPVLPEPAPLATNSTGPHRVDGPCRPECPDDATVQRRTMGIFIASTLAVGLYGRNNWWRDGFSGGFRTVNEGWFGQNTYAGGADKLGHFYMNYAGTRLFARAFEWAGNAPGDSLTLSAWLTLGTYTAVEVVDGFSKKWRFSKEDAVMNALGVGAALMLEKNPELDRVLDLRLLYQPSYEQHRSVDPFGDYSGQTYLIVAKASGIPALRKYPLLRYLELAVGYGARGYSDTLPGDTGNRSRNLYFGVSINLSELLGETVFASSATHSRAQRVTDTLLEYVQVPGTIAFARHRF